MIKTMLLGVLGGGEKFKQTYSVYDCEGLCPTITTSAAHGNGMPFILIKNNNKNICIEEKEKNELF